jgi:hypothetical protein
MEGRSSGVITGSEGFAGSAFAGGLTASGVAVPDGVRRCCAVNESTRKKQIRKRRRYFSKQDCLEGL